jgi:hypothetical protein
LGHDHGGVIVEAATKNPHSSRFGFANHLVRFIGHLLPFMIGYLHVSIVERNDETGHGLPFVLGGSSLFKT